jgi:hypothetical protein
VSDSNGYVQGNTNASSRTASGFIFGGQRASCVGCKVVNYRGHLGDGFYPTEWPYKILASKLQATIDVGYMETNQLPALNGDQLQQWGSGLAVLDNAAVLPAFGTASAGSPFVGSSSLSVRASYWNGSAAVKSDWTMGHGGGGYDQLAWTPPPVGTYAGTPIFGVGQLGTATLSTNYNSAKLCLQGSAYDGTVPEFPSMCLQNILGAGTTATSTLDIASQGSLGVTSMNVHLPVSVAALQVNGGASMSNNHGTGASVQHSDGTGTPGNDAIFNADGSLTNGHVSYSGSGTLTYTSITAPGCQEQPLTITGAASGDACYASPASDIGLTFYYGGCRVSAASTAQIKTCATATGTPTAATWTGWARH